MKWKPTSTPGVRYREHYTRRHGIKKDRYFSIRYYSDGKRFEEGLGWASEGMTQEKAAGIRGGLAENRRRGEGPDTLKAKRAIQKIEQSKALAESLTLAEFWGGDYIHTLKTRVKETSWSKEVAHYEKRISPLMGSKPLKSITPEDVDRMLDRMREAGLAPRTQEYAVGTLCRIWKHAAKRKMVKPGENPASGVSLARVNNTRLRVLTPQELKSIIDFLSVTDLAAYAVTLFCAFTGCRFSEAARLTWEHVDLSRSTAFFVDTKNKEPRQVFMVPELVSMMEARGIGTPGDHVFTMKSGTPFSEPPHAFRTAVNNLKLNIDRGDRDKVTFHTLRHTAATIAARRGVPVKDMQIVFGWKTPAMVFRYAKGDEDTQRNAMNGLAQSLTAEPAKVLPFVKKG